MNKLSYIRTTALENYISSDGQKFTELLREWANLYLRKCGVLSREYSIDGTSFRKDGGIDGLINAEQCFDPEGILTPKSVFQFKAGLTSKADIVKEITKPSKDGSARIQDYIKGGFKLIWFLGKGIAERDLIQLESDLLEIAENISPGGPRPTVIDANRFCQYLTRTPAIACRMAGANGLFLTSDVALAQNPHARFKKFVPGSHFAGFKADIISFFTDDSLGDPVKYIAGEPGIGKSRSVLEAVEGTPELQGLVCYLDDPTNVKPFFAFARQEGWEGYCIIDEYIGESAESIAVTADTIPTGIKAILIGHAHKISKNDAVITDVFKPLSDNEMVEVLSATFPSLEEFRIRDAIRLSCQNLRLARSICEYLSRDPHESLALNGLERVVDY